jgi:ATP-dependent Lhr-like helicase
MGIDIGTLDRVIQIGPPLSVSAFVQRLGRCGRLRGKPTIYFTSIEEKGTYEHPVNSLPWDLIKTIAIIELYLKEKWIEQDDENPLAYSLLIHQCLSILCSLGGHSPASLRQRVLSLPAFSRFSEDDFEELLAHLISLDLVEKTADNEIIVGLEAGHLTSHYSFYSVFPNSAEYRVVCGGREIGYINFVPPDGSSIVLAGRYWKIERTAQREIMVSPGESGGRQVWRGSGAELHGRVAARMRTVLAENTEYPYLSQRARTRLAEARELAKHWRLGEEIFIPADPQTTNSGITQTGQEEPGLFVLIPWLGSRSMRTLLLILQNGEYRKTLGIRSFLRENDLSVNIISALPVPRFRSELAGILSRYTNIESLYPLIDPARIPLPGKFDSFLPPRALTRQYASTMLATDFGPCG